MYKVILSKQQDCTYFPSERAVYRVIENIGLSNRPKHKPNGITEADREAHKSDNLLKMDFTSEEPLKKCVTDITEIKANDTLNKLK